MSDVSENVYEKMFDHGFEDVIVFVFCFLNFQKPYYNINKLIFSV